MVCLFEESHCSPALLKVPIYSTELLQQYLFEKYCVKCTTTPAATPLFVGECVNMQFHNSNCCYPLSIVNFLEDQLQTFALVRVTFGATTFFEGLMFQSTYIALIFIREL